MEIQEPGSASRRRVQHQLWALVCPLKIGAEINFAHGRGAWIPAVPGWAYLFAPGTAFWERPVSQVTAAKATFILFEAPPALGLETLLKPRQGWQRIEDAEGRIAMRLREMASVGSKLGDQSLWLAQASLCQVIHLLLHSAPVIATGDRRSGSSAEASAPSDLVRVVREYLQAHLAGPVKLPELARHARVSLSLLSHRYHRETGETPMQTLAQWRIQQVCGLLLKGWPLKEIAAQTGFADAVHLSHAFKKQMGCSPRRFQQQKRTFAAAKSPTGRRQGRTGRAVTME
jgi:AraC-like DNA-binding protein